MKLWGAEGGVGRRNGTLGRMERYGICGRGGLELAGDDLTGWYGGGGTLGLKFGGIKEDIFWGCLVFDSGGPGRGGVRGPDDGGIFGGGGGAELGESEEDGLELLVNGTVVGDDDLKLLVGPNGAGGIRLDLGPGGEGGGCLDLVPVKSGW